MSIRLYQNMMLALAFCSGMCFAEESAVDFENHIIPLLTKHGCNAGACHGAAIGRGGFKLSLYGGDPSADYRSVVRERNGRRVNLAKPNESLLLLKPTEHLLHGGGEIFAEDSASAKRLLKWVQEGAPFLSRTLTTTG